MDSRTATGSPTMIYDLQCDVKGRRIIWSGYMDYDHADSVCQQGLVFLSNASAPSVAAQWQLDVAALKTFNALVAAVMVRWWSQLHEQGGVLVVVNESDTLRTVLNVYGLSWLCSSN